MIKGIQILGMLVGFYLILQTLLNFYYKRYRLARTLVMIVVWSVMVVLFFNPSLVELVLPILTTQDVIMSVLVIGILGSLILVANVWQNVAKMEQKFTELVQNLALNDYINEPGTSTDQVDELDE